MEYMAPDASLDFLFDVTEWLAPGEDVATAVWALETGLTGTGQVESLTGSTLRIATAASAVGKVLEVGCSITTTKPNTFSRKWYIDCQEQLA